MIGSSICKTSPCQPYTDSCGMDHCVDSIVHVNAFHKLYFLQPCQLVSECFRTGVLESVNEVQHTAGVYKVWSS